MKGELREREKTKKGNSFWFYFSYFLLNKKYKIGDSNRFCDHLGFEWLDKEISQMTKLNTPTTGLSMFILTSCRIHSSHHSKMYWDRKADQRALFSVH